MARFTLPRDIYHGKGSLEVLKTLKGKKAVVVVGGGSMKRFGFLDKVESYLKEAGLEVKLIEGVEPDPSVETVMNGAAVMRDFEPDWIIAMGGGSPIDAAKAMWIFYEYPDFTFEEAVVPFALPELRQKAKFVAIPSTSGTAPTRYLVSSFFSFAESAFIAIGNARNRVRNRIVNLFIIIMCLFGNLKTFAPMGDADKTASDIFSKTTKRIPPLIIFTEVHGHKYSSFYLFDELFCPFHVIFSHSPIHRE